MNSRNAVPLVDEKKKNNCEDYLYDEKPILILPTLVQAIGFKEAIILQRIYEESVKKDNYNPGWAMLDNSDIETLVFPIIPKSFGCRHYIQPLQYPSHPDWVCMRHQRIICTP